MSFSLRPLKFSWRHARQVLEIFSKRRLIAEIQLISYLLHILARKTQQILGFEDDIVVDPLGGGAAGAFFQNQRKIFWRYKKLRGIKSDSALLAVMYVYELEKIADIACTARQSRRIVAVGARREELHELIDSGCDQRTRYRTHIAGVAVLHCIIMYEFEISRHQLHLLVGQSDQRRRARGEAHRCHEIQLEIDVPYELRRYDEHVRVKIMPIDISDTEHTVMTRDNKVVGAELERLQVYVKLYGAVKAENKRHAS